MRAGALRTGIAGAALIALLLTACGGRGSSASVAHIGKAAPTTTIPPAAGSGAQQGIQQLYLDAVAYVGCMRSHGDPNFPAPNMVNNAQQQVVGWAPSAQDTPHYRSANKTCQYWLPNFNTGPSQAQVEQAMAKYLKFSKCMRAHGLPTFPDPKENSNGISITGGRGLDPSSPKFQAAQKDCRAFAPVT